MKNITTLLASVLFIASWLAGIVLAKAGFSTVAAIILPVWGWYLIIEKVLTIYGWVV